jgi:hypothetical protein
MLFIRRIVWTINDGKKKINDGRCNRIDRQIERPDSPLQGHCVGTQGLGQ